MQLGNTMEHGAAVGSPRSLAMPPRGEWWFFWTANRPRVL